MNRKDKKDNYDSEVIKSKLKNIIELKNIRIQNNDIKLNIYTELLDLFENSIKQIKNSITIIKTSEYKHQQTDINNYVYHDNNGFLSYKSDDNKKDIKKYQTNSKNNIEEVYLKEFKYKLKIKNVDSLAEIKPMMSYFKGDKKHSAGVYCCLLENVYIKIPFPEMIDINKDFNKSRTIKCKYVTTEKCNEYKNKMMKFNSYSKNCNFAHIGDKIVKICNHSRCDKVSNYGNPDTFLNDVEKIGINDIKNILLYGLSDVMSSYLWFDYSKNKNMVLDKLDIA